MAYNQKMAELVQRFDRLQNFPASEPSCAPTAASIRKIEEHFGFHLPAGLIQFGREAKSFSSWFASLGRDCANPHHTCVNPSRKRMPIFLNTLRYR